MAEGVEFWNAGPGRRRVVSCSEVVQELDGVRRDRGGAGSVTLCYIDKVRRGRTYIF